MSTAIDCLTLTGRDLTLSHYLTDLARLRMTVFREFPYLYVGDVEYETHYLQTYFTCPDSIVVLALDDGQIIGASTGVPLTAESADCQRPFIEHGEDMTTIFYCGESVLLSPYRGNGIYRQFMYERERHARQLGCTRSCFCGVIRPVNHPRRPPDYQPLDDVWRYFGYQPQPDWHTTFIWQDLDELHSSPKPMQFWSKWL